MFRQVCNQIPAHMIAKLSRQFKIDARTFSATSHVFSLLYGHAAHALGLNDICDALMVHEPAELGDRELVAEAALWFSWLAVGSPRAVGNRG